MALSETGNLTVTGTTKSYAGAFFENSTSFGCYTDTPNNARVFTYQPNYFWRMGAATGILDWFANGVLSFGIDINGSTLCRKGATFNADGSFAIADAGTTRNISFLGASNYYLSMTLASGLFAYIGGGTMRFQVPGASGRFEVSQIAAQPGGGSWAATSDARIKTVLGNYDSGLDAINALQPVRYDTDAVPDNSELMADGSGTADKSAATVPYRNSLHYQAASDGLEFIGLVAQQAESAMPELVSAGPGYIDGEAVTDLRTLDQGPLVFALINAVKELTARIEALEAAP
jgi:hypothetical protein